VLKQAIGRERPDSTRDKSAWRNGGDSFPSGHTTAAFAVAQVLADSFPADAWGWRTAAYAMGAATAYARIHGNMHWFSDTVAGAALGMATGRFVSNRSANGGRGQSARLLMQPMQGGLLLSYTVDPYELFAK
jgi:membrane-associated phospholipid phosphatase